jgi:hypothetical protein
LRRCRYQRYVMEDRWTAIRLAIGTAAADDMVIIAGKGAEDYQEIYDPETDELERVRSLEAILPPGAPFPRPPKLFGYLHCVRAFTLVGGLGANAHLGARARARTHTHTHTQRLKSCCVLHEILGWKCFPG